MLQALPDARPMARKQVGLVLVTCRVGGRRSGLLQMSGLSRRRSGMGKPTLRAGRSPEASTRASWRWRVPGTPPGILDPVSAGTGFRFAGGHPPARSVTCRAPAS